MYLSLGQIELIGKFAISLKEYYGAEEISNCTHRQFTNPWLIGGDKVPGSIWILRTSGEIKFGAMLSRSIRMSERTILKIATRTLAKPSLDGSVTYHGAVVGRFHPTL